MPGFERLQHLLGHGRGSITSAIKDKEGLPEIADKGTLFLDEIGDMDLEVQAKFLKTVGERSIRRIGENKLRHLAEHILRSFAHTCFPRDESIQKMLRRHSWPGNVRELKNVLERARIFARGSTLDPGHFSGPDFSGGDPALVEESDDLEKQSNARIHRVPAKCGGYKNKACKAPGVSLSARYRRLVNRSNPGSTIKAPLRHRLTHRSCF